MNTINETWWGDNDQCTIINEKIGESDLSYRRGDKTENAKDKPAFKLISY